MTHGTVPDCRVEELNSTGLRASGAYVLVWMVSARRARWSWLLQHARDVSLQLKKPLLILEGLSRTYPWACSRFHQFVIEGMQDNARAFERVGIQYYPYVEPRDGAGQGLLEALSESAALVITDYKPGFFQSRMQERVAQRLSCRVERVDDNGLLPLAQSLRPWPTAHSLRRHLQRVLPDLLTALPDPEPLAALKGSPIAEVPALVTAKWPRFDVAHDAPESVIDTLSGPGVVVGVRGGSASASALWEQFLGDKLGRYHQARNAVEPEGTSLLSSYLHFGHLSSVQMVSDVLTSHGWTHAHLSSDVRGSRQGWWGLSEPAEGFLDQVITWREIGHVFCHQVPDFANYESLPEWALKTLEEHANDPRPVTYTLEELDTAATHDRVWNAAQNQLRQTGRIHNYLRMLWGKKILEWSPHPKDAMAVMIELNNRYALDGRDPNSYSGIAWCLGRFDRAWGPERPIFGKIRYMSSDNTQRKLRLKPYLERWDP